MTFKEKHMNIVLYGNGGAGNHGCEAIVRGTAALLQNANIHIQSASVEQDTTYGLDQIATIAPACAPIKKNLAFISAYMKMKLQRKYVEMDGLQYQPGIQAIKENTNLALSVGGDNYCYAGTEIYPYLNRAYHKAGIKTVLWGCSVEPELVDKTEIAEDLARYDAIVARESITYEAVKRVQRNAFQAPDPAFFMEPQICSLDPRFEVGSVIGINASPVILSSETVSGMAYENYRNLIQHILDTTDAYIALIPHVVWESNDDRKVLNRLYDDFGKNDRLILVGDHTAPELKYIISKYDFLVGARTHATIAAYSSCVPTLVVGYSVKARGIARDLFGTEDGYVLPVQDMTRPEQLTEAFQVLWNGRDKIHRHLENFLPGYLDKANEVKKMISEL